MMKNKINKIKEIKPDIKCLDTASLIILTLNLNGKITFLNKKGYEILNYKKDELIGKDWFKTCIPKNDREKVKNIFKEIILNKDKKLENYENPVITKNGEIKQILWRNTVLKNKNIKIIGTISYGIDVTDANNDKFTNERVNRSLRMISSVNKMLISTTDEKKLLNEICRIAVEIGGYRLAWVGYKKNDKEKTIYPVAQMGSSKNYVENAKLTWADVKRGRGPGGTAIRTGKPSIISEIKTDPSMVPWRKDALKKGYRSVIGLPLIGNKNVFGVILIYSNNLNTFSEEEINILKELADNLSFGIRTQRVREEINKLRNAVETSGEIVYMTNREGIITYINREFTKLYGYDSSDVLNKVTPRILKSGQRGPEEYHKLWKDILSKKIVKDEHVNKTKKGKLLIVESTVSPILDTNKSIIGFLAIQSDITKNKEIEKNLKENEQLVSNVNSIMLKWTPDKKISFVNNYGSKIFGYKNDELIGKNIEILVPEKESGGKNLTLLIKNILKNPKKYLFNQNENIRKDGKRFWVAWTNKAIKDKDGNLIEILSVGSDTTILKEIENKLEESEFFFKESQNAAFIGSYKTDFIKGTWESSKVLDNIFGINKKYKRSIEGWSDIVHPDDREMMNNYLQNYVILKHKPFDKEYRIIDKSNNKVKWVYGMGKVNFDKNNKIISMIGTIQDITKRKNTEEKLKEAEEKFRRLFEAAKDSILLLDANTGEITDSNPFIQDLLEYSAKELIGKKIFEISPFRDIIENKEKFNELQNKGYVYYDNLPLKTKSGIVKQVEFVSNVYLVADKKVIQCNIRDITERIKKEKELEDAKRDFLSLTSHQLRTPLSATKWVLESLFSEKDLLLSPKQIEKFNYLIISNEKLINLVNRFLDVTKIESGKLIVNKKLIDLGKLINDLVVSLKSLADKKKKNIKIINLPNLKEVYCDPILINESLENLLTNAFVYAKEDSKDITISVEDRKDDYLISVHNEGYIDTISSEKMNIFDKFSRGADSSKIEPSGSGLGLFITKKMMEASGGTIWFESNIKTGTTFYLTINKKNI